MVAPTVCIVSFNPYPGFGGVREFLRGYAQFLSKNRVHYYVVSVRKREAAPSYAIRNFVLTFRAMLQIIAFNKHTKIHLIHSQDAFYTSLIGLFVAKILRVPLIIHCHNLPHEILLSVNKNLLSKLAYNIEKILLKHADAIITLNQYLKRQIILMGVNNEKIDIIPVGVNLDRFQVQVSDSFKNEIKRELKIRLTDFIIGFVGRLSKEKNVVSLLNAFIELHNGHGKGNFTLLLIGDGPERETLLEISERYSLPSKVVVTGTRRDIEHLLTVMDVFVIPSYTEGLPLSLLEAMASSKSIIASNIPAIREIVRHSEEAILVNPHNVEELKQAILLLCNDPDLKAKLGRKASARAKVYDIDRVYGQILKVYEELVRCKAKHDTAKKL